MKVFQLRSKGLDLQPPRHIELQDAIPSSITTPDQQALSSSQLDFGSWSRQSTPINHRSNYGRSLGKKAEDNAEVDKLIQRLDIILGSLDPLRSLQSTPEPRSQLLIHHFCTINPPAFTSRF
jgi:hypothetical protein